MAMAKFTVDTTNKLFIAKAGVTEFDVKVDLYSDAKEHWLLGGQPMGFLFPMRPVGGDDIVAGFSQIPLYAFLRDGWRIRPDEADHTLNVTNGVLLVDGGGDPFVDTLGAFTVRINYQQPVQAIQVQGSSLSAAQDAKLTATHAEVTNIEGGFGLAYWTRVMVAAMAGKVSGFILGQASSPKFRDRADGKNRIDADVDAAGNRTRVDVDGS